MNTRKHRSNVLAWTTAIACTCGFAVALGACESDDGPSHTKTMRKESVTTPDGGRETITTTHEKKTEIYPK